MREKSKRGPKPKKSKDPKPKPVYTCPHCKKQFTDNSSWSTHIQLHSTELPYSCDICDYKCKIKKYLTRHVKKAHTKPVGHQCPVCGKCFHFDCKLRDHMRVHTGEKPYKCKLCDKAFSSSYSLNVHKLIHTGEKPFQCSFCDYACRDNSTIRRHMERHQGISKDFPCSICNKNFKKKETLQLHVEEVHLELDPRKYPCVQCNKLFKTKGTLNIHRNTVHKRANRVKCEICGGQITKNNINSHMRRHIDVRPYKCSFKTCGRRFKDKGDLNKHSRIHYPHRQYLCHVCNRRFPRKFRLTAHLKQHTNRNYYQCHHCGEMFPKKMYLSRHIKTAHGPNPRNYICDICGLVTYTRKSITNHLKYGHGTENDTICQICNKDYEKYLSLKDHYLKYHSIMYNLLEKKKEGDVSIKEEPDEEIEASDDPPEFVYELEVQKHEEIDAHTIEVPIEPQSPQSYAIDSDTITYSKKVLSEDISRSLIERENSTEDAFDDFFIGHVLKKPEDIVDMPKDIVDEKKKEHVEKSLAKLLSKVRIRKQCKVLEKLRRRYNRRIKMATSSGNKKEQKSIRYYKTPEINNKTNINGDTNIDDSDKINDETMSNDTVENQNNYHDDKNDDQEVTNDKINDGSEKNCDKINDSSEKNIDKINEIGDDNTNKTNDEHIDDDDDEQIDKDDDANDSDYKDSDIESNSNKNGRLKFNTHQCYICFKLFKTKTDLKRHCTVHFDICNDKMLKKCPFCGYVTNLQISRHIKLVHKIVIDIPYGRIKERDTQNGSKYVFEIDKNCDLEIIPSISNLNKIASMRIDEKNRDAKNLFTGITKLVRKGKNWVVEKKKFDINQEYLLPEFTDDEYKKLKPVGDNYLERIKSLSVLAKTRGIKILYPCEGCEKICLTLSALKLHNRKHETNPKRYKPKVWKHKLLNNKSKSDQNVSKSNKKGRLEVVGQSKKKKNLDGKLPNRFADPNPVRNKHKCDKELIEFYKNNIKGGDIEFWQFLKIFNKMSRENVNDFKDLENRYDFGMHNIKNIEEANNETPPSDNAVQSKTEVIKQNRRVIRKKISKCKNKAFTRAIMISKNDYLKRLEIKNQMRRNLQECKS